MIAKTSQIAYPELICLEFQAGRQSHRRHCQLLRTIPRNRIIRRSPYYSSRRIRSACEWLGKSRKTSEIIQLSQWSAGQTAPQQAPAAGALFGSFTDASFGQSVAAQQPARANAAALQRQQQFQQQTKMQQVQPQVQPQLWSGANMAFGSMDTADVLEQFDFDAFLEAGDAQAPTPLAHPESTWEESGLTATYELPGARNITPSFTPRRFRIAIIALSSIALTHIVVPGLCLAAYLRENHQPFTHHSTERTTRPNPRRQIPRQHDNPALLGW